MTFDAVGAPLHRTDSPTNLPTTLAHLAQAIPLSQPSDLMGGIGTYVFDSGHGQLKPFAEPSGQITSMTYSHIGIVEPANVCTSLAWDHGDPAARLAQTRTTLVAAVDAVVPSSTM